MAAGKPGRSRKSKSQSASPIERKLPQSPEAEVALLGSLLFDPTVMGEVVNIVGPDHFHVPGNAAVAQVIWDLWNDNEPIDPAVVYNELRKRKQDTLIGGHEGLMRLADAVPEASHAARYGNIVKEKAVLRNLISACQEIILEAYTASEEVSSILDGSEKRMYEIAHDAVGADAFHIGPLLHETMRMIDERGHAEGLVTGLQSGFADLDNITSGFQKGELIVLAARPSMGKTTLALNMADRVAVSTGKAVALFSLEMSAQQIARNMLCSHARVDAHKLRTGYLESERYSDLSMAVGVLSEAKIFIDDSMGLTPFQVKAKARRLKAKHDISMVIVDYLQLLDAPKAENRQQEISIISRQLKALAKELNIPVLTVSQLSRAVESREGNRPRLSDLRESGAIEQDADVVMLLFREDYYLTDESKHSNVAELNVAKQRNGPTGMVKLRFFKEYLRFESLSVDRGAEYYAEEAAAFEG
jgi:replicative DNA helicase